jgi:hypothetical protein
VYNDRKNKFLKIGRNKSFVKSDDLTDKNFGYKDSFLSKIKIEFDSKKYLYYGLLVVALTVLITLFSVA